VATKSKVETNPEAKKVGGEGRGSKRTMRYEEPRRGGWVKSETTPGRKFPRKKKGASWGGVRFQKGKKSVQDQITPNDLKGHVSKRKEGVECLRPKKRVHTPHMDKGGGEKMVAANLSDSLMRVVRFRPDFERGESTRRTIGLTMSRTA